MCDVAIVWDNREGHGDWAFANGDLAFTTGLTDLENTVAVSLFTDARCADDFVPWDGSRRGWWATTFTDLPWGSTLWELDRGKITGSSQMLLRARDAAKASLQWLVGQGIVATLQVTTYWVARDAIGIDVMVTQPMQDATQVLRYQWCWR